MKRHPNDTDPPDDPRGDAGETSRRGLVSRRDFLVGSGASVAGLLLAGCADRATDGLGADASGVAPSGDLGVGDGSANDGDALDGGVPLFLSGWLPLSTRSEIAYQNGDPDSRGLQFERVITWYRGSRPDKLGWVITGQDENSVRISKDYGRSWTCPPLVGLYCSQMSGLYLDDDALVAVGSAFATGSWTDGAPYAGLYIGDPDLGWAKRLELTRASGTVGPTVSGSSGLIRAFARMCNGGSSRQGQNCVARRPQSTGLTAADRPIWVIEQQLQNTGDQIAAIYVWKIVLSGVATVASAEMVIELPLAAYAQDDDGIYHVEVAPNGDVMLIGKTGVFVSSDGFATLPVKIYPASGNLECSSGAFYGGSASTPSGARIGVFSADAGGGVWQSTNVRTQPFAKPVGSGGAGNAGLPANYAVWQLGMSPTNPNLLAVCSVGDAPYRSTDGGQNFTQLPEPARPGDAPYRYRIRGPGPGGFHFCPTNDQLVLIPTAQTMERSTDGLATIDPKGSIFFDGMHDKGWGFGQTDWKQMLRVAQDSWVNTGLDGPSWFLENGLGSTGNDAFKTAIANAGGGSENYVTGACGLITAQNRVIAACSRNAGGQSNLMLILDGRDPGTGNYASYLIRQSGVKTRATISRWSPKNDGVGFVGRWAVSSTDAALAANVLFTDHASHEIVDCALDGTTLVSFWGNFQSGNDGGNAFYRSTHDLGTSQQDVPWYTLPSGTSCDSRAVCMDLHHPTHERLLYVRNNDPSTIREIKSVSGKLVDQVLVNLRTMPGGVQDKLEAVLGAGAYIPEADVTQLIADPNQPGLFYAICGRHGMPNWWSSADGGVTWVDISGDLPRTLWFGAVHPYTGDVLAFSSMGQHCLPPPEGYPAIPNRAAYTDQLRAFYAEAAVPDPPTF